MQKVIKVFKYLSIGALLALVMLLMFCAGSAFGIAVTHWECHVDFNNLENFQ